MDVRSPYNNVCIKEGDQWKAAFIMHKELFKPTIMFFGLCNSPATFQRFMNDSFQDMIAEGWLIIYMDDLLIFSDDSEVHQLCNLCILQCMRELSLPLKLYHFWTVQNASPSWKCLPWGLDRPSNLGFENECTSDIMYCCISYRQLNGAGIPIVSTSLCISPSNLYKMSNHITPEWSLTHLMSLVLLAASASDLWCNWARVMTLIKCSACEQHLWNSHLLWAPLTVKPQIPPEWITPKWPGVLLNEQPEEMVQFQDSKLSMILVTSFLYIASCEVVQAFCLSVTETKWEFCVKIISDLNHPLEEIHKAEGYPVFSRNTLDQ